MLENAGNIAKIRENAAKIKGDGLFFIFSGLLHRVVDRYARQLE
jgi:hypothetical protein